MPLVVKFTFPLKGAVQFVLLAATADAVGLLVALFTVEEVVAEHPLASVTVTTYVPGPKAVKSSVTAPLFQR